MKPATAELVSAVIVLGMAYSYALAFISGRNSPPSAKQSDKLFFVLLIPVLNEERVIARTLTDLLRLSGSFLILVIDDCSDDGTVSEVQRFLGDPRVRLLERNPDEARLGKGAALNAAYSKVQALGLVDQYGAKNVIVVVFDADARVEPHFLEAVAPYFEDERVAGVQSAVRMYNLGRNLLTRGQHLEFVTWGEVFSRAKDRLGSATLGGNGQCARLAALAELGSEPWRPSLTEDFDLSVRLLLRGWRLRFCPSVAVWQEAIPHLRGLVRQRSRWLQGHFSCWHYLPDVVSSRMPLVARSDLVVALLLPSVFLPVGLTSLFSWGLFWLELGRWEPLALGIWYCLGFGWAPLAALGWQRAQGGSWLPLLAQGHLYIFYSFVWFLAGIVTFWNVLLGRRAWEKTSRAEAQPAVTLVGDQEIRS